MQTTKAKLQRVNATLLQTANAIALLVMCGGDEADVSNNAYAMLVEMLADLEQDYDVEYMLELAKEKA